MSSKLVFINELDNYKKKGECKRISEYLKANCHIKTLKHYNNVEYFISSDVNLECIHRKSQYNHYCINLCP